MKFKLALSALLLTTVGAMAENPLVTHIYTADPTARVFDGKLYVFPSCDAVPPAGREAEFPRFCMPGYHAFTLENGNTWKDHGWILKENDVPWGERDKYTMWAPDCIEKDGKYYYFFPAHVRGEDSFQIGMGVADNPTGPYKWAEHQIKGVVGIDPGLLLDDADNQAYLFFGGGHELKVAPLSDDMTKITKDPIIVEGLPAGYKEGAFPFKKDGLYYLTFAHVFPDEGYTIGYATSENPMGPYQYRGKIIDNLHNGTNHGSVVNYNGQWILFYHFWHVSGFNKLRSMCADYLEFKEDGSIKKVIPTLRGIGYPTLRDTIQIDRCNEIVGAQTAFVSGDEPKGWMVCETNNRSYVRYNGVDFGNGEATKMAARFASGQRIGKFEVRKGDAKGALIATFPVKYTGGWDEWTTVESDIETKLTGLNDICVVFIGENCSTKVANLNWLMLK